MKRTINILISIILVAVICLGFTGCHKKGAIAVTVDGEAFAAGFYSCALVTADSEALSIMTANKDYEVYNNSSFLNDKIGDVVYTDWVKNRTIEILKEFVAAKRLCEENTVDTAETLERTKQNASLLWAQGYSQYYDKNGVSEDTFKKFNAYNAYRTLYFNHLYGENGKEAIPAADIEKHLNEKYVYVNSLVLSLEDLTESQITEIKNKVNEYADRLKKGESFETIYNEANGATTEVNKDEAAEGKSQFSHSYAEVWSDTGTQYENVYYSLAKDMAVGEIKVLEYTNPTNNDKSLVLVLKGKIFDEANTNLETMKTAARHDIKDAEFDKMISEKADSLNVVEDKKITKQFKVEKIYFPES